MVTMVMMAETPNTSDGDWDEEPWPEHDIKFFAAIQAEIDKAYLTGRGKNSNFQGEMPWKLRQLMIPPDDPEAFFSGELLKRNSFYSSLFCCPHVLVWLPELTR